MKRILSVVLCTLLLLGVFPMSAMAQTVAESTESGSAIESISAWYGGTVVEHCNGYWTYDSSNDTEYFYYHYDTEDIHVSIEFNDGRESVTGSFYDFLWGEYSYLSEEFRFSYTDYQDYEGRHWTIGGENTVEVQVGDATTEFSMPISLNPVVSLSVEYRGSIIEHSGGYWDVDRQGNDCYYYRYDYDNIYLTIEFNDERGTVTDSMTNFWNESAYLLEGLEIYYGTNQEESPWVIGGENLFTVTIAGISARTLVSIIETPVANVTASYSGDITENMNGYWDYNNNGDSYFYYHIYTDRINLTVEFNDGRESVSGTYDELSYGELSHYLDGIVLEYDDEQSESSWVVGGDNSFTVTVGGVSAQCFVNVVPSPIANVTAEYVGSIVEDTNGYICWEGEPDEFYYYYINDEDLWLNIEFSDGREPVYASYYELRYGSLSYLFADIYLEYSSNQYDSDGHWAIGGENIITVRVGDKVAEANVNIVPSPVKSVSVAYTGKLIENTSGYWDNDQYGERFFYYNVYSGNIQVTIEFNDERGTITGTVADFVWGDYSEYVSGLSMHYNADQHYNHWTVDGDNILEVYVGGCKGTTSVVIAPSPIENIVIECPNTYYMSDASETYYYNPDTGEEVYYKEFYADKWNLHYTVTLTDGTVYTGIYYTICNILGVDSFDVVFTSDQGPYNEWGPGTHYFTYNAFGITGTFEYVINDIPIERIEAYYPQTTMEYTNGSYIRHQYNYGEYTGWFFCYDFPSNRDIFVTLYFNDGRESVVASVYELRNGLIQEILGLDPSTDSYDLISVSYSQGPNNAWGVGDNVLWVEVCGLQADCIYTVTESNIADVSISCTKDLTEGFDSYNTTDDQMNPYVHYDYDDYLEVTVTYKDNTSKTQSYYDFMNEYSSSAYFEDGQSSEGQWGIGTHTVQYKFLGYEGTFDVTVTENPVKSVTAEYDGFFYENISGWSNYDYSCDKEYFYYSVYSDNIILTVELADGTVISGYSYEVVEQFEAKYGIDAWFYYDDGQGGWENEWTVGDNIVTVEFGGKTAECICTVKTYDITNIRFETYETYDGYFKYYYNEETGEEYNTDVFIYTLDNADIYATITFADGTTERLTLWEMYSKYGLNYYLDINQGSEEGEIWQIGKTYTATVTIYNKEYSLPVKPIQSPAKSVTVDTSDGLTVFVEYRDGTRIGGAVIGIGREGVFITNDGILDVTMNISKNGQYFLNCGNVCSKEFDSDVLNSLILSDYMGGDMFFFDMIYGSIPTGSAVFDGTVTRSNLDLLVYLACGLGVLNSEYVEEELDYGYYWATRYDFNEVLEFINAFFNTQLDEELLKKSMFYRADVHAIDIESVGIGGFGSGVGNTYVEETYIGKVYCIDIVEIDYENPSDDYIVMETFYIMYDENGAVKYIGTVNPAKNHTHAAGEWETVKEATCISEGMQARKCTICGETMEEKTVKKTAHTVVDGKCTVCGAAGKPGDISGEGIVNAADILLMKSILVGSLTPTDAQRIAADMNGDGKINSTDVVLLKRVLVGG